MLSSKELVGVCQAKKMSAVNYSRLRAQERSRHRGVTSVRWGVVILWSAH